jgi:DNA-binding NarL/FixJ family response regulator
MISLYIAESHHLTRLGIEEIVATADDIIVKGHSCDGQTAMDEVLALEPDVALLNINIASLRGVEVARRIVAANQKISVLFFATTEDADEIDEALSTGAKGCVSKQTNPQQLVLAIRSVAEGALWIDSRIAGAFLQRRTAAQIIPGQSATDVNNESAEPGTSKRLLSAREQQVLELIGEEMSNKQIAKVLGISPETVKTHVRSIMHKMKADRRGVADSVQREPKSYSC